MGRFFSLVKLFCIFVDTAVESAAKTSVGSNYYQQNLSVLIWMTQQRMLKLLRLRKFLNHIINAISIGPSIHNALLRFTKLCSRHHFHGFCRLLSLLRTVNFGPNVL